MRSIILLLVIGLFLCSLVSCDPVGDLDLGPGLPGIDIPPLTYSRFASDPNWSPDGTQITFISNPDSSFDTEIYVMDADGSNITRLTYDEFSLSDPHWSPDGTRIAFNKAGSLYVMDAGGSNPVKIPNGGRNPDWSPDDTQIAFESQSHIFVMNEDGSNKRQLTNWN